MASLAAAAVTGAAVAALYAGHHLGDHVVQTHRDGLVAVVAPIGWPGAAAALAASGATHAVIDRRWPVRLLIAAKGCHGWPDAPYLIDLLCTSGCCWSPRSSRPRSPARPAPPSCSPPAASCSLRGCSSSSTSPTPPGAARSPRTECEDPMICIHRRPA
jgi:hypothetical protein